MQKIIKALREALASACNPDSKAPLYDEREARSIIDLLLEEVCSLTRVSRVLHPDWQPSDVQRDELMRCASLLAQGMPVQQVLGYEWFCGRRFRVTPDVLIPRPETAELISWICQTVAEEQMHPRCVIDFGTGSGCIAVTLAADLPEAQVVGFDLSQQALNIARQNACELGVDNLQFAQCDILKCVDNSYYNQVIHNLSTGYTPFHNIDIIVSNPPYICRREAVEMSAVVLQHEPEMALFVPDDDPLLFYRHIARFAHQHLASGGHLFFEINAAYGQEVVAMLHAEGFSGVELRRDVNGRDRMVHVRNQAE